MVSGFGAFPGAPANPTEWLIETLRSLPAPPGIELDTHILPVIWATAPLLLRSRLEATRPDAVLMFGLAGRSRSVRIETRAVNQASEIALDADGRRHPGARLQPGGPASRRARCDRARLRAAIQASGAPARLSRDAGTYLCNAVLWAALEATAHDVPVVFVHVPPESRLPAERLLAVAKAVIEVMGR